MPRPSSLQVRIWRWRWWRKRLRGVSKCAELPKFFLGKVFRNKSVFFGILFVQQKKFSAFHGCRMRLFWSDYVVSTVGKPDTAKSAVTRLKQHGAENTCAACLYSTRKKDDDMTDMKERYERLWKGVFDFEALSSSILAKASPRNCEVFVFRCSSEGITLGLAFLAFLNTFFGFVRSMPGFFCSTYVQKCQDGLWVMMPFLNGGSMIDLVKRCAESEQCQCMSSVSCRHGLDASWSIAPGSFLSISFHVKIIWHWFVKIYRG